jgi:hypothetical protein
LTQTPGYITRFETDGIRKRKSKIHLERASKQDRKSKAERERVKKRGGEGGGFVHLHTYCVQIAISNNFTI